MLTELNECRSCGRIRGDLSMLCASCLRMATMAAQEDKSADDHYDFRRDKWVREDRGFEPIASDRYYKVE